MRLNKYSESKSGATVGSNAGNASSSGSSASGSSRLSRDIWGQHDNGGDIDGDMFVAGNVFVGEVEYDDDEQMVPPHSFPSEDGNLFVQRSVASPEVFGYQVFLNVNGVKTNLLDILMPVGSVIMFDGKAALPANWAVCDGKNGTPDLRGKFIKGVASKDDAGKTGGSSTVELGNVIPKHTHKFYNYLTQVHHNNEINTGPITIDGRDLVVGKSATSSGNPTRRADTADSSYSDIPYIYNETDPAGEEVTEEGAKVNIEPPFYTLIYIMRVK